MRFGGRIKISWLLLVNNVDKIPKEKTIYRISKMLAIEGEGGLGMRHLFALCHAIPNTELQQSLGCQVRPVNGNGTW
jgi:hypothetical protein